MIDIKVSIASHGKNLSFENFSSKNLDHKNNFHINSDIKKADYWIVFEDLTNEVEYCEVPKENVIYLNNETSYKKIIFLKFIWLNF